MTDRRFALVVFGATGYTGRLVADAVARRSPADLPWAIAGRDRAKLDAVAGQLGGVPTVVADASDAASVAALAESTRAVVTTVGPYARYGTPLVAACAQAGTHYADLTAESTWVREVIDRFGARAEATGARIVPSSGFDSLPSDLGVRLLQEAVTERTGRPAASIVHAYGPMSGGVSGGTVASALDLAEQIGRGGPGRAALADPDLLAPGGARSDDPVGAARPTRHAAIPGWTAPFVMAPFNAKVVRRTRFLAGEPWGEDMRYLERLALPTWARAAAITLGSGVAAGLLAAGPTRRIAARLLPKPGEGPRAETRDRGFFESTMIGYDASGTPLVHGGWRASGDPGYAATARMLAEMGLHLATADLEGVRPGVTTPALAGGNALAARLAEVDIRFGTSDPVA